jgi:hypothetical protein
MCKKPCRSVISEVIEHLFQSLDWLLWAQFKLINQAQLWQRLKKKPGMKPGFC